MTGFRIADLLQTEYLFELNLSGNRRQLLNFVSTDTRTLKPGAVFIALRGEKYDAHEFVQDALKKGARAIVVEEAWYEAHKKQAKKYPLLVVKDTFEYFTSFAYFYRKRFDCPIIAVTGSNGKTTTKELLTCILKKRYRVNATIDNQNNHIGVPLTLFRLSPSHNICVLEMGTNQPGDIAHLARIAVPSHALITNIGKAHLAGLKDRESIAEEKGALFRSVPPHGLLFWNKDEPLLRKYTKGKRVVTYAFHHKADVQCLRTTVDDKGCVEMEIQAEKYYSRPFTIKPGIPGMAAAQNALAVLTVALAFRVPLRDIREQISKFRGFSRRLEIKRVNGITVIDDAYNANPDSVRAAVDVLKDMKTKGRKILVLGDMLELGKSSAAEHQEVGEMLVEMGFEYLFTFGRDARRISDVMKTRAEFAKHYTDKEKLCADVRDFVARGDAVLVKGSNAMQMDEVVAALVEKSPRGKA
ncbi:MAG: UDP-N-acetylmuramoyl-tripeptide--D-alanyl-D-alanine ligase [Chlorobi bacterium]|nr:UDP-N-acetylmuramoyl-tripeptide--D-alanyl-D-alanine ligase [Chlorobiota bacterium]